MNDSLLRIALCGLLPVFLTSLRAEVRLPSLFSDHMVLQGGEPAPVWGWAAPSEKVTVSIAGQSKSATAGADGKWMVKLDKLEPSGQPRTLTVAGTNTLTVNDVLVGEVWLCSGQSNMAMQMDGLHGTVDHAAEEIAAAKYPQLRLFTFDKPYDIFQLDVPPQTPGDVCSGRWWVCSPETAAHFSALGYLVGRELHKQLGSPVGMIVSSVGGTPIEAWASRSAQQAQPDLQPLLKTADEALAGYDPVAELAKYTVVKTAWLKERAAATKAGNPIPKAPLPFKNRLVMGPGGLFNAHINPLIPYAIRGVLWYQGERNADGPRSKLYGKQLKTLIEDWRTRWGNDFYFVSVQLPNLQKPSPLPVQETSWTAFVREGILETLSLPRTGMAITVDLGGEKAGHPTNKQAFADRLSRVVLHDVYGKPLPFWSGPLYRSAERKGREMVLTFKCAEGLKADGGELKGFAIAGGDKKFVWAKARIENDKVVVWADEIAEPAAVRYSWASNPAGTLRNGGDLPASPFRTDSWE